MHLHLTMKVLQRTVTIQRQSLSFQCFPLIFALLILETRPWRSFA